MNARALEYPPEAEAPKAKKTPTRKPSKAEAWPKIEDPRDSGWYLNAAEQKAGHAEKLEKELNEYRDRRAELDQELDEANKYFDQILPFAKDLRDYTQTVHQALSGETNAKLFNEKFIPRRKLNVEELLKKSSEVYRSWQKLNQQLGEDEAGPNPIEKITEIQQRSAQFEKLEDKIDEIYGSFYNDPTFNKKLAKEITNEMAEIKQESSAEAQARYEALSEILEPIKNKIGQHDKLLSKLEKISPTKAERDQKSSSNNIKEIDAKIAEAERVGNFDEAAYLNQWKLDQIKKANKGALYDEVAEEAASQLIRSKLNAIDKKISQALEVENATTAAKFLQEKLNILESIPLKELPETKALHYTQLISRTKRALETANTDALLESVTPKSDRLAAKRRSEAYAEQIEKPLDIEAEETAFDRINAEITALKRLPRRNQAEKARLEILEKKIAPQERPDTVAYNTKGLATEQELNEQIKSRLSNLQELQNALRDGGDISASSFKEGQRLGLIKADAELDENQMYTLAPITKNAAADRQASITRVQETIKYLPMVEEIVAQVKQTTPAGLSMREIRNAAEGLTEDMSAYNIVSHAAAQLAESYESVAQAQADLGNKASQKENLAKASQFQIFSKATAKKSAELSRQAAANELKTARELMRQVDIDSDAEKAAQTAIDAKKRSGATEAGNKIRDKYVATPGYTEVQDNDYQIIYDEKSNLKKTNSIANLEGGQATLKPKSGFVDAPSYNQMSPKEVKKLYRSDQQEKESRIKSEGIELRAKQEKIKQEMEMAAKAAKEIEAKLALQKEFTKIKFSDLSNEVKKLYTELEQTQINQKRNKATQADVDKIEQMINNKEEAIEIVYEREFDEQITTIADETGLSKNEIIRSLDNDSSIRALAEKIIDIADTKGGRWFRKFGLEGRIKAQVRKLNDLRDINIRKQRATDYLDSNI